MTAETPPRRRGARPTPLPAEYAEFLDAYATALDDVPPGSRTGGGSAAAPGS